MGIKQEIIYLNKSYEILNTELEFIVHPAVFEQLPITKASLQCSFSSNFHIENYQLLLDKIVLTQEEEGQNNQLELEECKVFYSGVILIASNLVKEYYLKSGKMACFSYQSVFELIFENGMLITTVDQSKAMLRIRKNIELGLRSLNKSRDFRCIMHFISSSLIGDYKPFLLTKMRLKYLKDMKRAYENN